MFQNSERKNSVERFIVAAGSWILGEQCSLKNLMYGATALLLDGLTDVSPGDGGKNCQTHPGLQTQAGGSGKKWMLSGPEGTQRELAPVCSKRNEMRNPLLPWHYRLWCAPPPPTVYLQVNWGAQSWIQVSRKALVLEQLENGPCANECIHHSPRNTLRSIPPSDRSWFGITDWLKIPLSPHSYFQKKAF